MSLAPGPREDDRGAIAPVSRTGGSCEHAAKLEANREGTMANRMFPDVPLLGEQSPEVVARRLRDANAIAQADAIEADLQAAGVGQRAFLWWGAPCPYKFVSHQFGYIPPLAPGAPSADVKPIGTLEPDASLKGKKLIVRLDVLRTYEYPGSGEHQVLVTCKGVAQIDNNAEPVSFSKSYRSKDLGRAAVVGQPIFVGLETGDQGVGLQCSTVNVRSAGDEDILNVLESQTFDNGLKLLTTAQPVLKPFTEMTVGLAKTLAKRNRNFLVQDFYLGLDFDGAGGGARLRIGSYIAVQAPSDPAIDWRDWIYSPNDSAIVLRADAKVSLPYNYLVFRVGAL
jgi:hypothetical protein